MRVRATALILSCPVQIYRSKADNWVPFDMTEALAVHLLGPVERTTYEALGHYGTLHRALAALSQTFAQRDDTP